jgi:signal transduction histidine kinase
MKYPPADCADYDTGQTTEHCNTKVSDLTHTFVGLHKREADYNRKQMKELIAAAMSIALMTIGMGLHRRTMRKKSKEFDAVLSERARIARDIHDGLIQALTVVVMQLETARLLPETMQAQKHLDRALELARKSIEDARRNAGDLRSKRFQKSIEKAL